jgi:hypothetical protein
MYSESNSVAVIYCPYGGAPRLADVWDPFVDAIRGGEEDGSLEYYVLTYPDGKQWVAWYNPAAMCKDVFIELLQEGSMESLSATPADLASVDVISLLLDMALQPGTTVSSWRDVAGWTPSNNSSLAV